MNDVKLLHIKCCFFKFFNSPVALKNEKIFWPPQEKVEMTPLQFPLRLSTLCHCEIFVIVSSHMYPENSEGTQVIVGSMNMGYISDTARNRTHNLFRPKREPIALGHSGGQTRSVKRDGCNRACNRCVMMMVDDGG